MGNLHISNLDRLFEVNEDSENKERRRVISDQVTLDSAHKALEGGGGRSRFSRLLPFLGPAFIASVAYVDPGNFATNIEGGAKFGYTLLWVIVASNWKKSGRVVP